SCQSLGFDSGTLGCGPNCAFDTSRCGSCGNARIDGSEECDGSEFPEDRRDCYRATGGPPGTTGELQCSSCRMYTSRCAFCGNGIVEFGEGCDGAIPQSCNSLDPRFGGGTPQCTRCQVDTSTCTDCGNRRVEQGEECDGEDIACSEYDPDFEGGMAVCDACRYDLTECSRCGDGVAEADEECDSDDLRGETCESRGAGSDGTLACNADCTFDVDDCEAGETAD